MNMEFVIIIFGIAGATMLFSRIASWREEVKWEKIRNYPQDVREMID
jgi:hypothetical protein